MLIHVKNMFRAILQKEDKKYFVLGPWIGYPVEWEVKSTEDKESWLRTLALSYYSLPEAYTDFEDKRYHLKLFEVNSRVIWWDDIKKDIHKN